MKLEFRICAAMFVASAASFAGAQATAPVAASSPQVGTTAGEVRKIDKENRKITLKHGEIKHLDMPGMTMVFQVKDPTMLDAVREGDKVQFKAERAGGVLVITDLKRVP